MRGSTKKGELFQFARWFNLMVGLYNLFLYVFGGNLFLLGLGAVNIAVWVFTRAKG
jgi:hypothetical protein